MIKSLMRECAFAGIDALDINRELDKAILSHICQICKDLNVSEENLDEAFYFNRIGKYEQFLNKESYIKTYGKISVNYVSEVIMCYKKYLIAKNREIKPYESPAELPMSKEYEKEALIKAFQLTKENVIREYKAGKSIFDISTKWIHTDYYHFFDNKMTDEQKAEYLENVKELVRQNKIKEYQSLHDYPIPKEMKRYVDNSMGKISNYAKCLWMTEQIIKEYI
jgi:hypothetical protein